MKRGLYGACTFLASLSLVVFAVGVVAWVDNLGLAHGRFILPGARSVAVRFDRVTFAVGYDRPAGRSMLDEQGHLIDERVREGLDTRNLPPAIHFQGYGFRYQHFWQGRSLPYTADAGRIRPMTSRELRGTDPSELTTRVEGYIWGLPSGLLLLLLAAPPIYYFTGPRRRRRLLIHRRLNNLCLHCGYDLRASKECCPECGRPILPR
jgi:hypothetical protein